jgi:hypothetical protein
MLCKLLCCFLLLPAVVPAYAGEGDNNTPVRHFIKWNLSSMVTEPDQAVALAYEFRATRSFGVQLEAGYIFNDLYEGSYESNSHTSGFRVNPELRMYLGSSEIPKAYVSAEGIFKMVQSDQEVVVGRNCVNGACDYSEWVPVQTTRNVSGVTFKFGLQPVLGKGKTRIALDFYAGAGIRFRWYDRSPVMIGPNDILYNDETGNGHSLFDVRYEGAYPTMVVGFRMGLGF